MAELWKEYGDGLGIVLYMFYFSMVPRTALGENSALEGLYGGKADKECLKNGEDQKGEGV